MMPVVHRRAADPPGERRSDEEYDDTEPLVMQPPEAGISDDDDESRKKAKMVNLYRLGGLVVFLGLVVILTSSSSNKGDDASEAMLVVEKTTKKKKSGERPPPMADYADFEAAFSKYEGCTVSFQPPPAKSEWDTKPLWLPAFPGSGTTGPTGKGDILKPIINGITGLKAGGKFYHASSKILKRCKGVDETATCANGHPVVEVAPEKQVHNFYSKVILVVRNYRTVYPVFHNDKAEAYHHAKGQCEENEWRRTRDEWYQNVWNNWKSVITTWKDMKEYDIGTYVQYEELMSPERGPAAVQRIANLLQEAGFTVAPKDDIPCLWFRAVKDEYLRLKEYWQYTSGYTREQRDYIVKELDNFINEVADDEPLVAILKEYSDDIRENTYIDIPHQKSD